jgi:hypothetical protein
MHDCQLQSITPDRFIVGNSLGDANVKEFSDAGQLYTSPWYLGKPTCLQIAGVIHPVSPHSRVRRRVVPRISIIAGNENIGVAE